MCQQQAVANDHSDDSDELAASYEDRLDAQFEQFNHDITDWLTVGFEIESDYARIRLYPDEGHRQHSTDKATQLSAEFQAQLNDTLTSDLSIEIDTETDKLGIAELLLTAEFDKAVVSVGKATLPFASLYSHFLTDPFIDFSDIEETAVRFDYAIADDWSWHVSLFQGRARRLGHSGLALDGVSGLSWQATPHWLFAAALLSDLADSDEQLLEENAHRYHDKVAAATVSARLVYPRFEATFEAASALGSFVELDAKFSRPRAVNLELAFKPNDKSRIALRGEYTREIEDAPRARFGIAASYQIHPRVELSAEWLRGRYRTHTFDAGDDADTDDSDEPTIVRSTQTGLALLIRF